MKVGDLVKCNEWVHDGKIAVIVDIQPVGPCQGAWVLLDVGIKLVRLENLETLE